MNAPVLDSISLSSVCTADEQFVFAVYRKSFNPEVNPASLALAGDQSCLPVLCTPDYAIFKFPVTGCGTRTFVVGETRVYLAEVQSLIQRRQWTYGLVTSDSPFSLLVECRYSKGNVASTGFLVKTPTDLRPAPHLGVFQVQLQIAKDGTFSQFYPSSSLPVSLLLGSRVYLELRLINPTDPSLVLLVHYCIAYPRSSSAVWVLLYQGCPNVLDYGSSASLHVDGQPPHSKLRRRFSLRTFQFLSSGLALDEEISFMCSTEVCSPDQRRCNEGCFDGRDTPISIDPSMRLRCAGNPCPGRVMLEGA
ncbi:zona pellucida sperm-binding protein 4-like [Acipenser ruthenus]|uniref:zona pellucida sperm-binding protein 4-like n=1 Tax=Acipenser ruthenus TaxID=7906 RepID=UPI0027420016|nr:zona pellucida sperm-binding protein 4-like [Acipenser ruthenus]